MGEQIALCNEAGGEQWIRQRHQSPQESTLQADWISRVPSAVSQQRKGETSEPERHFVEELYHQSCLLDDTEAGPQESTLQADWISRVPSAVSQQRKGETSEPERHFVEELYHQSCLLDDTFQRAVLESLAARVSERHSEGNTASLVDAPAAHVQVAHAHCCWWCLAPAAAE